MGDATYHADGAPGYRWMPGGRGILAAWPAPLAGLFGLLLLGAVVVAVFAYYLRFPPADFDTYYNAASDLRRGERLYEDAVIWREVGHGMSGTVPSPTETTAYIYPPFLAVAFIPLSLLPREVAHAVWCALIVLAVAAAATVIAALLRSAPWPRLLPLAALVAVLVFAAQPTRASLTSKQVDGTLLLLLVLSLLAFARRRDALAGLWFGLAIAIKPFLVVLALFYVRKRAYRATVVAAVASAALALGPFLVLGPGAFEDYLAGTSHFASPAIATSPMSQSIYAVLLRSLTSNPFGQPLLEAPWLVLPLRVALSAAVLVLALWHVMPTRTLPVTTQTVEHGIMLAAGLLVVPLAEDFHFTYLAAAFAAATAVALRAALDGRSAKLLTLALAAYLVILMLPATRSISHAFYRYADGPVGFPLSLALGFHFALLVVGAGLLLATRRLDRARAVGRRA